MPSLPLLGYPSVSTTSLEEAQASFSRLAAPIEIEQLDRSARFRWLSHRLKLGSIVLAAHQYGAAFRASADEAPAMFTASFPLSDVRGEAIAGGASFEIARGRATFVSSPSGRRSFDLGTAYCGLQLIVDEREMTAAFLALTGAVPREPLRFEPRMALDSGVGAALDRLLAFMVSEIDRDAGVLDSPVVSARFSDAIVAKMLLGHPHNAQRLLEAKSHPGEPRHVRLAAEFLEANAGKPIRMADLARAAGASIRALQSAFLKFRGSTPMQFLRERRLDLARRLLSAPNERPSVSEVALECGFTHLGRFSADYFARFGEYPSTTRARTR